MGQAEINACNQLLQFAKGNTQSKDKTITGFNIGINNGESAGQSVLHCHIHLIPRRIGDVENPRGGVRHIIVGKGNY
jgi:diadenosine tetraphosphate (Ap4A) HIT family hydrolase